MDIVRTSGSYRHKDDVDLQHEVAEFDMSINNCKDKSAICGIVGLVFLAIAAVISVLMPGSILDEPFKFTYANGIPSGIGFVLLFLSLMFTMMHSSEESLIQSKRDELDRRGLKPKLKEGGE